MNQQVVLLGRLQIDTDTFLAAAKQALGRNLNRKLDSQGKDVKSAAGWLALLGAMKNPDVDPNTILEDPGHLLAYTSYLMMAACDHYLLDDLLQTSRLNILTVETLNGMNLVILHGTLEQWRTAIINGCSDRVDTSVRMLFDQVLAIFEKEGLAKIWSDYTKKSVQDGTFKLIERY